VRTISATLGMSLDGLDEVRQVSIDKGLVSPPLQAAPLIRRLSKDAAG
jgi:hypothetical protein